jgi:hypothetical protein
VNGFDKVMAWQPDEAPAATTALNAVEGRAPAASHISYSTALAYAIAVIGTPILLWFRRRTLGRNMIGVAVFLWGTITYAYVTSTLLDVAENNRLRYELGPVPLVLALVVVLWSIEPAIAERHRASRWWRWFGLSAPLKAGASTTSEDLEPPEFQAALVGGDGDLPAPDGRRQRA